MIDYKSMLDTLRSVASSSSEFNDYVKHPYTALKTYESSRWYDDDAGGDPFFPTSRPSSRINLLPGETYCTVVKIARTPGMSEDREIRIEFNRTSGKAATWRIALTNVGDYFDVFVGRAATIEWKDLAKWVENMSVKIPITFEADLPSLDAGDRKQFAARGEQYLGKVLKKIATEATMRAHAGDKSLPLADMLADAFDAVPLRREFEDFFREAKISHDLDINVRHMKEQLMQFKQAHMERLEPIKPAPPPRAEGQGDW